MIHIQFSINDNNNNNNNNNWNHKNNVKVENIKYQIEINWKSKWNLHYVNVLMGLNVACVIRPMNKFETWNISV